MEEQPGIEEEAEAATPELSPAMLQRAMDKLESEQNLIAGILAGFGAALGGAAIWAAITAATDFQIGWMAVGVGFLVGFAVRAAGKGIRKTYGVVGALLALLGCLLGNLFIVCYFVGVDQGMGFFEVLVRLTPDLIYGLLSATFNVIDLVFYAIACYEGYRLAFRRVTDVEILEAAGAMPSMSGLSGPSPR